MIGTINNDPRIPEILSQLEKFTEGDYKHSLDISDERDEIDSIGAALNRLGNTLLNRENAVKKNEERIRSLLEILLKFTIMDFSKKARIDGDGDEIDALAAGLNALGEEVLYHITKLRESEEQVNTIFKNAPDAVIVIDSKDVIQRWNPAATRIFGWGEEEVTGRLLHTILIPERYRDRHQVGMKHFLKTGEGPVLNKTVEMPSLRKNNSEIAVELTISPAKLNEDYLFVSFLRDITERKQAEQEIRQLNTTLEQRVLERTEELNISEKKYRTLFENNPMPLWVLDVVSLRILDVNDAAIRHYGYSRDEFLSMTSVDLRPEKEKARYLKLNRRTMGTQNTGVWTHCKKDGTLIQVEVIVHEMLFEGTPARLILANDVTEKTKAIKALQLSENRFRGVFESKITGFLFWDAKGNITEANDLFLEMIGYTREDLEKGRICLQELTPPEYAEVDNIAMEQIHRTGVCEPFEKQLIRQDGNRLPVMLGAAAFDGEDSLNGVSLVMDISQRKMMEQEVLNLNSDLEKRIEERTRELKEANKELESFSYSVSHDLRAPLRAIHGYSQMLFEDYESKLNSEGIRLLNAVKFNAKRMGQLVDDLLAFSRMGKRGLNKTMIDLTTVVNDVLNELSPEEKARTKITVNPLGTVIADDAMVRQVFQNLISNAVKYSSKKENPLIEIGSQQIDGELTYSVKDNGAGFDMAYYNKLFGVFNRLHQQEEFEGTGVGLAIVQRIIQRHGGKVWGEGKVNGGAVFYFTLSPSGLEA